MGVNAVLESIGNVRVVRGAIVYGSLVFEGRAVPVVLASGAHEGPTLLAVGLQHTGEFSGPAVFDSILAGLDCSELSGTLVCLPVANPLNYSASLDSVLHHHDGAPANINRQWPGDPASSNALSRLAAFLWDRVVSKAGAIVDLHSCRVSDPFFAACLAGHRRSEELALVAGLDAIDLQTPQSYAPNLLFMEAPGRLNIPSVLIESPPTGFQPRHTVTRCMDAVTNLLHHLGMMKPVAGDTPGPSIAPPVFVRSLRATELIPAVGGFLGVRHWPGEFISRGDVVAEIRSVETFEVVERLVSPLDGAVACVGDPGGSGFVKAGVPVAVVKPVGRIIA
ncbi:MAG: hypothetical protein C0404_09400 [Verrucomicrobia bacterium]|nr:hypothetical protein [Verrucomicrobiota bacterium]